MGSANNLTVNVASYGNVVNKNIYGHFSEHLGRCIYGGLFVGENSDIPNTNGMRNDVVEALRNIKVPVLRWPGGCFADEYHWKDGIGPKQERKRMVNTHWGGVTEDNSFGTHEFMELCAQIGCEPYINGNVGSGTVAEMSEWVEYMTFSGVSPMAELREKNGRKEPWTVKYFGIGNENWGCGGNMRPEFYADLYRQFQTYVRNYGDNKVYKIAGGPHDDDYEWTDAVMKIAGKYMDALTMHYYTIPGTWQNKGSATGFTVDEYYTTLKKAADIEKLLLNHLQIMNRYDPEHRVGLIIDEWGSWYDVEPDTNPGFLYQQNTMRDAMIAALSLNIFNRHSDRVVMTNIAQTVNVLQAIVLTEGPKMVLTPTYHVFDLYKAHQDAVLLDTWLESSETCGELPALSVSATKKDQTITVTSANISADNAQNINCAIAGATLESASGRILSGKIGAYNDFSDPECVSIRGLDDIGQKDGVISFSMPPCSVAEVTIKCRA